MRTSFWFAFILTSAALATCPLGFPPGNACPESAPTCGLFTDSDGDGLCDNPGPQPSVAEPDTEAVEPDVTPADTIVSTADTTLVDPDTGPDTGPDSTPPDPVVQQEVQSDSIGVTAPDSASQGQTTDDSDCVVVSCPLGYTPEQACYAEAPSCALYRDEGADGRCDNPGPLTADTTASALQDSAGAPPAFVSLGCPRGLPPAAACPYERQLCPHWAGRWTDDTCGNPSTGRTRTLVILCITAVLLAFATIASRKLRGGRKTRRKARATRLVVLSLSLLLLGFVVQGCFCPLGAFQYALGGTAISFLGLAGILLLALPVVHALFFGRVYCGWVCPMGAFQEILWKLDILRLPQPGRKLDRILLGARTVLFVLFCAAVVLAWRGILDVPWAALFCEVDPFRAVFTLFLAGNLVLGLAAAVLSILWGRFFCRYLCFYGFVLGLACRAGLWTKLCRLTGRRGQSCGMPGEPSSGSCEIGTKEG